MYIINDKVVKSSKKKKTYNITNNCIIITTALKNIKMVQMRYNFIATWKSNKEYI